MIRGLLVKPPAKADLASAHDWYDGQRPGLGDEFLLCVEAAIETTRRFPESWPLVQGDARQALTRRFPYGIYDVIEPTRIVVLAVLHTSRDPDDLGRRLAGR